MPIEIFMPALSPTMTEGNLVKWCKKEDDKVKVGDLIAEIETDKATMEVEALESGTLGRMLVPAGTKGVTVGTVIALLLAKGEPKSALDKVSLSVMNKEADEEEGSEGINEFQEDITTMPNVTPPTQTIAGNVAEPERWFISPLGKRIAEQHDVDVKVVEGSGPRGRIVKSDVMEFINQNTSALKPSEHILRSPQESSKVAVTGLRKVIADKLSEVKRTTPHFYLSMDSHVDKLLEMRADINKSTDKNKPAFKISVNDLIVKAIALAFREFPEANASWQGDHIAKHNNVDASIAVAVDGGIFTPIVKNADQKSIFAISKEVKDLAKRAKSGNLTQAEFLGGSFTISNLGMYGIDQFTAIINPPQSCIFAIGGARKVPIARDDKVVVGSVMNVTISCDHRVVDGAVCASLMNRVKEYIENPIRLII